MHFTTSPYFQISLYFLAFVRTVNLGHRVYIPSHVHSFNDLFSGVLKLLSRTRWFCKSSFVFARLLLYLIVHTWDLVGVSAVDSLNAYMCKALYEAWSAVSWPQESRSNQRPFRTTSTSAGTIHTALPGLRRGWLLMHATTITMSELGLNYTVQLAREFLMAPETPNVSQPRTVSRYT